MSINSENQIINELKSIDNFRTLGNYNTEGSFLHYNGERYINLSSNDYLGLSSRVDLQQEFFNALNLPYCSEFLMSNPSSRLMTGNSEDYYSLERYLGELYNNEALVLSSGYLLNSSLLRAITTKSSIILADKQVHSSLIDGILLSKCKWERFKHNDMEHLEQLLKKYSGKDITVVAESVYSMDGDLAPISTLAKLKRTYRFTLVLDEAHSFGVFGDRGKGLSGDTLPDYRIVTMGKSAASSGAFIICNKERKELLINKLKGLIYSTAISPIQLKWSLFILQRICNMDSERTHLHSLITILNGTSQIIPVVAGGNAQALKWSSTLRTEGFWVTAIRSPTVAKGTERVRISLTAAHTVEQINRLSQLISTTNHTNKPTYNTKYTTICKPIG